VFDVMRTRIAFRGEEAPRAWLVAIVLSLALHAALLAWPHWPSLREIGGADASLVTRIVASPEPVRSAGSASDPRAPDSDSAPDRERAIQSAVAARPERVKVATGLNAPEPARAAPPTTIEPHAVVRTEREPALRASTSPSGTIAAKAAPVRGASTDIASVAQYRIVLMSAARRFTRELETDSAQGLEGRVEVRLAIASDGSLARAEVARSSGHALLDDLAVEMLRNAKPHAPVPPALLAREFEVDVPVVFTGPR
jgi:periplasmic protein TonB